jgi:hypothetical protein
MTKLDKIKAMVVNECADASLHDLPLLLAATDSLKAVLQMSGPPWTEYEQKIVRDARAALARLTEEEPSCLARLTDQAAIAAREAEGVPRE